MTNDKLKAARTQWRRRRAALKRRDSVYQSLVDAEDLARDIAREADRQAQFWGFHGPESKRDESVLALNRAWEAQTVARQATSDYETEKIGPYPEAALGPVHSALTVVPPLPD